MSCNSCNTKFNFFHKEMSCPSCGLSFCKGCLKQKLKIPSKSPPECNVCRICYNKFLNKGFENSNSSMTVPDTFLKRLENLQNPAAPSNTVYKDNSGLQNLRSGLTPADQLLVDRLERLKRKENKAQSPTEEELRKRLTALKGEKYMPSSDKNWLLEPDKRSDGAKADDLLEQFIHERDIELAHSGEEELKLKSDRLDESSLSNEQYDSEEEVERITRKVQDEVGLEEKTRKLLKGSNSAKKDDETEETQYDVDEFPWCVLCNEDAKFRCLDCGGDLYCDKCNKEIHKEWDRDHQVVAFTRKSP